MKRWLLMIVVLLLVSATGPVGLYLTTGDGL